MGLRRPFALLAAALTAAVLPTLLVSAGPARAVLPIEDYADYQPARRCAPAAKPGTVVLSRWIVRRHGGGFGGISRACRRVGTSEHHEGRAFDWSVTVHRRADRIRVRDLFTDLFATDARGNPHARARRMGVMYVIWNDRIRGAWNGFRAEPYRHSACKVLRRCSPTLRHRDHVHISLSRPAARGRTSWYLRRL